MTEKLKQIVKEETAYLPKEMQNAISSLDWGRVSEEIGKKYLLSESEVTDLQVETLLVLIGFEDGESYATNVENNVGTTKEEAENIMKDADQKIFTPIYDNLAENIKKNLGTKKSQLDQTFDFILSGGNYSVFLDNMDNQAPNDISKAKPIGTSSMQDMKDKLIN